MGHEILASVGGAIISFVAPLMFPSIPEWMHYPLFALGTLLLLLAAILKYRELKSGRDGSGITVKMRDNNAIGQIGNRYDRREKE